ncbi:MAG: hypothetical protein HFH68_00145 [Lachnospiraceae bacterium]|nr:hypothetical protein [Lachnospiraceae bacterium]
MIATDFEFNGVKASDVNLAIVDFNSPSREGVVSSGGKITFNSSKAVNSHKWNFHGSHYEEQLSFSFQVARINLERLPQEVLPASPYEKAYYMRWLCRKDGYKYLRFLQNGYESIFYNSKIDLEWINYGGCTYGAELTVTCDAPFGYSLLQSYEARLSSGNSFTIYNDSDETGSVMPQLIEIEILTDGDFRLSNSLDPLLMVNYLDLSGDTVIKGCKKGEVITINGITKQIATSLLSHDVSNSFNYVYPRLIKYPITQLSSWADAYEKCTVIIYSLNNDIASSHNYAFYYAINTNGTKSSETVYDALLKKYIYFKNYIESVINEYQGYVDKDNDRIEAIDKRLNEINAACNLENYLGKTLYNELLSFKREQVYNNNNFISDGLDDSQLMARIEELIDLAKEELAKACQLQYTITIKMGNLLSIADYRDYYQYFALGNYIRARYDSSLVKMRLASVSFDFSPVENIDVTFSDTLTGNSLSSSTAKILENAKSMATSFSYIKRQSAANDKKLDNFTSMFENGLDATKTLVMNSDNNFS